MQIDETGALEDNHSNWAAPVQTALTLAHPLRNPFLPYCWLSPPSSQSTWTGLICSNKSGLSPRGACGSNTADFTPLTLEVGKQRNADSGHPKGESQGFTS